MVATIHRRRIYFNGRSGVCCVSQFFQFTNSYLMLTEKSGKTLHLLKSGSKPIKPRPKRKKVDALGTLDQFHESKKKHAATTKQQNPSAQQQNPTS